MAEKTADLLFELATEEIPASYQKKLIADWHKQLAELLKKEGLTFGDITVGGTPRRIYCMVSELLLQQPVVTSTLKGPPKNICFDDNGKAQPPLVGFAKKAGIDVEQVQFTDSGKGEYAVAQTTTGGARADELLETVFSNLISGSKFPRSMRWSDHTISYARPIQAYTCAFDNKYQSFDNGTLWQTISSSENIAAHFILDDEPLQNVTATNYIKKLEDHKILADPVQRKNEMKRLLQQKAQENNLTVVMNEDLLNEVNFLVERVSVIVASFEEKYLDLPDIVTLSEMQEHQKYFGTRDTNGNLTNNFLVVTNANVDDPETLKNVKEGNERVLRARLADGAFFFNEDKKQPLVDRVERLKSVVFMEGMGSLYDKTQRLENIALLLNKTIETGVKEDFLKRAAQLSKTDLTTHLVYEFDHLQGEIGKIYAALQGEPEEVANAIFEHYLPRNQADITPQTDSGRLLSMAEKLDNIIAGFIMGKQPTSSQDPLALRRQAIYLIEMIIEAGYRLNLRDFLDKAVQHYSSFEIKSDKETGLSEIAGSIWEFMLGRLATIFEKTGFDKKMIRAGLHTEEADLYITSRKLEALKAISTDSDFTDMMTAFKRMNSIVEDFIEKSNNREEQLQQLEKAPESELLTLKPEQALLELHDKLAGLIEQAGEDAEKYSLVFQQIAQGRPVIDSFFDEVMVMAEDQKQRLNRVRLLAMFIQKIRSVLDLGELQ